MILRELELDCFKNIHRLSLSLRPGINVIYGDNGAGKTNLLDAIYLLSLGKSHFHLADNALIRDEEEFYRVVGHYSSGDDKTYDVVVKHQRQGKKQIELNRKKVNRVKELLGRFPVVFVAPDDISLVFGGGRDRRNLINRTLCQCDSDYLVSLMKYNRLLRQKDAMLKKWPKPDRLEVETYNYQMIPLVETIHLKRSAYIDELGAVIRGIYADISDDDECVSTEYKSQFALRNIAEVFREQLDAEISIQRPLVGIQRDDILLYIEGKLFKKFGSQGQIKSLLYSMRMSEYHFLSKSLGEKPILLLDDYFEKLDGKRLSALLLLIQQAPFGQVILTDTELSRSQKIFERHGIPYAAYAIDKGELLTAKK